MTRNWSVSGQFPVKAIFLVSFWSVGAGIALGPDKLFRSQLAPSVLKSVFLSRWDDAPTNLILLLLAFSHQYRSAFILTISPSPPQVSEQVLFLLEWRCCPDIPLLGVWVLCVKDLSRGSFFLALWCEPCYLVGCEFALLSQVLSPLLALPT